ncbi:hypothetical protein SERLA73DRAFT_180323 [Serpula lacrymans var. lacrymans S7.3]|uniref:Uncharacterized protein n=2 Tax=Serpula lacrymans var. lacrymans TaxID=341189 RepID=F8PU37_SERL3|nr:uncharacterized protein SERLADRAFT_465859 [Serpula lacrymans var. lacrymans S7.9]EGN99976.1 hypothetical protein SERLA73DRAFT_180323 [Serpula lacrymans var. lacrymans S7.3]EGO25540.1 hypothetical protein SERLADRAFT_465859 [Serpula lacrymans var. lacrymans S7.9]
MTEVTVPTIGKPAVESPQEAVIQPDQVVGSTQNTTAATAANGSADSNADLRSQERSKTPPPVVPSTPIVPVPRPLRKSPSVRVVDAFGRERLEENGDADKDTNAGQESSKKNSGAKNRKETKDEQESTTAPHVPATSRNNSRSAVRIVDAMGREVEENLDPSLKECEENGDISVIDDIVMGRDEALAYVKATLREFQEVSSDVERSGDEALHVLHLQNLDGVSLTARGVRGQLTCDLRNVKENEPDLSTKYASMRESRSKRIIQPTAISERRLPIRTMIFVFVVFQIIIALWMFRFANREAHRLFYTDYYDPWYPELYDHYKSRSSAVFSSHPWSVEGFFEALKTEGWGVASRVVARAVGRSENEVWKTWGKAGHRELCPT